MKVYDLQTALAHPEETTHLYIRNRNLKEIPTAIFTLKKLKVLGLSTNQIRHIPQDLEALLFLEQLDLSGNQLQNLPEDFPALKQLKLLNLDNNRLHYIPKSIGKLLNLEQFSAVNNQLEKLHARLFVPRLKSLNVSNNLLTSLPAGIQNSPLLEKLFLARNKLKELPKSIHACQNLRQIKLDENRMNGLPERFEGFKNLEKLTASKNKIKQIPEDIDHCTWLRELDLRDNKIQSLPENMTKLQWLSRLYLQGNEINDLPETMNGLMRLEYLNLEYNQLQNLPESIFALSRLQGLLLRGNTIDLPKNKWLQFKGLKKISSPKGLFHKGEAKRLLTFLKHCRELKTPEALRFECYDLMLTNKRCKKSSLIQALNFPMKKVRKNALDQLFKDHHLKQPISKHSTIAFLGKTLLQKKQVAQDLGQLGISYQSKLDQDTTHVVLGHFADAKLLSKYKAITYLREQELQNYLTVNNPNPQVQFSPETLDNLRQLLLSNQVTSLELAIQILKQAAFPKTMITELFIAYKETRHASSKRKLRTLLALHASKSLQEKLSLRLPLSRNMPGNKLRQNIECYNEETELEAEKLMAFFDRNNKKEV